MSELHLTAEEQAQFSAMQADDAVEDQSPAPQDPGAAQEQPPAEQPQEVIPPQPPAQKTVPLAALHEAREQLKAEKERGRLLEERTNLLLQRFNQPQPQPQPAVEQKPTEPAIPDIASDPVGHILGTQQHLARQVAQQGESWQQQQAQLNQNLQQMQLVNALTQQAQALERQFAAEQSDYPKAVEHLTSVIDRQLQHAGITDPVQRNWVINQERLALAARMIQQDRNPAKAIYDMAKNVGYAVADQQTQQEQQAASDTSAVEQRLQNIAAGQQQAQSLGNVRGSGPAPLTAQRVINMSQKEFEKLIGTPELAAIMGA